MPSPSKGVASRRARLQLRTSWPCFRVSAARQMAEGFRSTMRHVPAQHTGFPRRPRIQPCHRTLERNGPAASRSSAPAPRQSTPLHCHGTPHSWRSLQFPPSTRPSLRRLPSVVEREKAVVLDVRANLVFRQERGELLTVYERDRRSIGAGRFVRRTAAEVACRDD